MTILYSDVEPLSKYSPVMLHLSPTRCNLSLSTNFLYTVYFVSKFFHNNEVKIVVFIGLFMLEFLVLSLTLNVNFIIDSFVTFLGVLN